MPGRWAAAAGPSSLSREPGDDFQQAGRPYSSLHAPTTHCPLLERPEDQTFDGKPDQNDHQQTGEHIGRVERIPVFKDEPAEPAGPRSRAEDKLGAAFDVRDFHDAVLANGALSLPALDRQIDDFIAARQNPASPANPPAAVGAP